MHGILLAAYVSLAAGDVGITCHALRSGFHAEGNPIYMGTDNCAKIAVIRGAGTAGGVFIVERVKSRKAKVIAYAVLAGVNAVPVIVNMRTLRRR